MNFSTGDLADFAGLLDRKSRKLQAADVGKGTVRCAAVLCGISLIAFPLKGNVVNLATGFPRAFPLGEGGLPQCGKTDEILDGWFRAYIATEARSMMLKDLRR